MNVHPGPHVGVVMGSRSDWETMQHAAETLDHFHVPYEVQVVSAHRTPDKLFDYAEAAEARGLKVLIAGAGGSADYVAVRYSSEGAQEWIARYNSPANGADDARQTNCYGEQRVEKAEARRLAVFRRPVTLLPLATSGAATN